MFSSFIFGDFVLKYIPYIGILWEKLKIRVKSGKGCKQMISNQVLQNTLEGLKEISRTEFCIIDTEGKVLATTFSDFSIQPGDIQAFVESQADSQLVKGFQYFKVCDDYQLEYILVAHGDDEDTYMVGQTGSIPDPESHSCL